MIAKGFSVPGGRGKEGTPKKLVVVHQVGQGSAGQLGIPACSSTKTSGCVIFASDLQVFCGGVIAAHSR